MNVRRRDNKNRVLYDGESQRADGRYAYKYIDVDDKAKFVYSWKLVDTDTVPQGKRDCVSLRTQEAEIQKRMDMLLSTDIGNKSLIDCYEYYINSKANIKESTRCQYKFVLASLKKEDFCYLPIKSITTAKAKQWFVSMSFAGKKYSNLNRFKAQLSAMYKNMIENEMISKNPFNFQLSKIIKNDTIQRTGLTLDEEQRFLDYISSSRYRKYYDAIYLMLNTGLRLGEFCGLTLSDIDLERGYVSVNHQISYYNKKPHISSTKTANGKRLIPITDDVRECLNRIIAGYKETNGKYAIDGVTNFLFINKNGRPLLNNDWQSRFNHIVKSYNDNHNNKLPNITPHILRHTYCSKLVTKGVSVKTVQYLMGHNNAQTTLNIYTHINYDDVENEIASRFSDT